MSEQNPTASCNATVTFRCNEPFVAAVQQAAAQSMLCPDYLRLAALAKLKDDGVKLEREVAFGRKLAV